MKLNSLSRALRENRFLAVVLLVGIVVVITGFGVGELTNQSGREHPQQTNRLVVTNGTAQVTENSTVNYVNLTVRRGTRDVNLSTTTIEWLGPRFAGNLVFDDVMVGGVDAGSGASTGGPYFRVVPFRDPDTSVPVVNDRTDRFKVIINVTAVGGRPLASGDDVELKLITARRAVSHYEISIPKSLDDRTIIAV